MATKIEGYSGQAEEDSVGDSMLDDDVEMLTGAAEAEAPWEVGVHSAKGMHSDMVHTVRAFDCATACRHRDQPGSQGPRQASDFEEDTSMG
jgi:hypothetical protein